MPFKNPHPLYNVWHSMKQRCYNPKAKQFDDYGGRGITVCARWRDSFANFVADMGERPPKFTLERIDNALGYGPGNCRWASRAEQMRNRRCTRFVIIGGERFVAAELAKEAGIKGDTIIARAALGLSFEEVMSPEPRKSYAGWRKAVAKRVANQRAATHCKHGHEWTPENTRITPEGWKNCRACAREKMRRLKVAQRALRVVSGGSE